MLIYKITNKLNGKAYIGQTIKSLEFRLDRHKKDSRRKDKRSYLYHATDKYGWDNFNVEIVEDNVLTKDILNEKEKFYILKYDTLIPNGYNMTAGGTGGDLLRDHPRRDEIYKKQAENRRGEKNCNFGKHMSEETKQKLREVRKLQANSNKGRVAPIEERIKMSSAHRKPWSQAQRDGFNNRLNNNPKGCSYKKRRNKWTATLHLNKRNYHLGYFNTAEEASRCYTRTKEAFCE